MCAPNKNLTFLTPLLFFTRIFCAFPRFEIKNSQTIKSKILKKVNISFATGCLVFWTTIGVIAIQKDLLKLNRNSHKIFIPVRIMSLLVQCVLALFSFIIVVALGFAHTKSIGKLFKNLDWADFILDFNLSKTRSRFYLNIFVFFLIQVVYGYYNYRLWKPLDSDFFEVYAIRIFQIFQFSLVIITTNTLCFHLYQRYKKLNELLKNFDPSDSGISDQRLHNDANYKYFMFKELKKLYSILCDQIDSINDIFGLSLLCFILAAIIMICYFIVHVLTLSIVENEFDDKQKMQLIVICASGISFIMIEVISLAWAGALLATEISKTHKISYGLLNILPDPQHKGMDKYFRKDLKHLAIQSGFRQPFLSTSGIFKVDFRILGVIIGSVTSYIIVAQQFLQQCAD